MGYIRGFVHDFGEMFENVHFDMKQIFEMCQTQNILHCFP